MGCLAEDGRVVGEDWRCKKTGLALHCKGGTGYALQRTGGAPDKTSVALWKTDGALERKLKLI